MSGKDWSDKLASLRVAQRHGERAVHKPLLVLMILGRAQRGESSRMSFAEVDQQLATGLRMFGAPVKGSVQPELPFWHLQSDGLWVVENARSLPRGKRKDRPTRNTLVRDDPVGYVPAEWWQILETEPERVSGLASQILNDFWPASYHLEILDWCGLELDLQSGARRPRDPEFRRKVLRAYEHRCAACDFDGRIGDQVLLDAAHVKWHCEGGPDSIENGLALCALHHVALDRGAIGIDLHHRLTVSQDLIGHSEACRNLVRLVGRPLRAPQPGSRLPASEFVGWHSAHVFRPPPRAG